MKVQVLNNGGGISQETRIERLRPTIQDPSHETVSDPKRSEIVATAVDKCWGAVEECPKGYPSLAAFLSSDRSFMQYRGFGSLHARLLLAQQYDVERLEDELDRIDRWYEREGYFSELQSKRRDDMKSPMKDMPPNYPSERTRSEVLVELKEQLMCYGKS